MESAKGIEYMHMVETINLHKEYRNEYGGVHALTDINLCVENGEFVAVMGPSGSGKSTLMNILGCLDRPSSGVYKLCGQNTAQLCEDTLADVRNKMIGFVFQSFLLLPDLTALENVELPMRYSGITKNKRKARAQAILNRLGLQEREHHLPSQLSGGQRQRVAIARALANNPSLILADEPTGNLDSAAARSIMELFAALNEQGHTLILITHDAQVAGYAQRVITMQDGIAKGGYRHA
jgi:putative ABC transport system ATP-binding protein